MTGSLHDWNLAVKNLLFPIFCKECRRRLLTEENGFFCPMCWEISPRIQRPFCSRCGRPHPGAIGFGIQSNFPCALCNKRPHPHISRIFGAARYDGAIAQAIKLFKFYDKRRLVHPLAQILAEFAQQEMDIELYDLIVPVPLHRVRERLRGYNQSRILAQAVAHVFPNATLDESLKRIRPTRIQSRLQGEARKTNVRGAFAVAGDACRGKNVLLIDDVITTASTVTECAAALRRARAARVDVLAVALAAP